MHGCVPACSKLHALVGTGPDAHLSSMPHFNVCSLLLQASLNAFENADTPVHMVMVEILGLNMKGAAAAPLFQCMFFLHESAWWSQVQLQGLRTQTHPVEKNVARWAPPTLSHLLLLEAASSLVLLVLVEETCLLTGNRTPLGADGVLA